MKTLSFCIGLACFAMAALLCFNVHAQPVGGMYFTIFSCVDGTNYIAGTNHSAVYGVGTYESRRAIAQLPTITHGTTIVTGMHCVFALSGAGEVYAWGSFNTGNRVKTTIGLPLEEQDLYVPYRIDYLPPIRQVASGGLNAIYLTTDSLVLVSGENYFGAYGNGTRVDYDNGGKPDTGAFYADISSVVQVAAGDASCFALTSSGEVYGWGANIFLMDTDTAKYFTTPQKIPLPAPARLMRASYNWEEWANLFILDTGGVLYGLGENELHELGISKHWVKQPTKLGTWTKRCLSVAPALEHTLVLLEDGTVWAAGSNKRGQLGQSDLDEHEGFIQVPGLTNIAEIAAGGYVSFARRSNGTWYAWGDNLYGEIDPSNPMQILSKPTIFTPPCTLTSVQGQSERSLPIVFPTPTNESVTVRLTTSMKGNKQVVVYNQQGLEVLRTTVEGKDVILDVSRFSAGMYTVMILGTDGAVMRSQIVVQ